MNNDLIFHWACDLKTREESPGALATLRHVGHHGLDVWKFGCHYYLLLSTVVSVTLI
jgi:hypothetical protein